VNAVDREKKYRNELTDRIVKRNIYIQSKGAIKYCDMTPEMIAEKRAQIKAWRERRVKPKEPTQKVWHCRVCGKELDSYGAYCGDECRKVKMRRDNYETNRAKKVLKDRPCKECGNLFTPEYGNKRRVFCSDECLHKQGRRKRRQKERARLRSVKVDNVNAIEVFMRDGWRCQLCKRKLKSEDKGTYKDVAPELDHIIPLSMGGEHSYRNTQCVCRRCNIDKGNEERGQLRMFG